MTKLQNRFCLHLMLAAGLCQSLVSCVTKPVGYQAIHEPMTADLEAKVLSQTKLSGTFFGVASGVLIGAAVGYAVGAATHTDPTRAAIEGGIVGGLAGGVFGYQKGQEKGRKLVATAQQKDQLHQLVDGAKKCNQQLAEENAKLRRRLASAKASKDKTQLAGLKWDANQSLREVNSRLSAREKAIEKIAPNYRAGYTRTLPDLQREKAKMESVIRDIAATESTISL